MEMKDSVPQLEEETRVLTAQFLQVLSDAAAQRKA